jgi:hypothetical protein
VDKEEALEKGVASLRIATSILGTAPTGKSSLQLPLKPILIQPVQGATNAMTSLQLSKGTFLHTFRSILSINSMNLVYRIQHILFPILSCIQKELSAMASSPESGVTELYEGGVLPDGVGVKVTDQVSEEGSLYQCGQIYQSMSIKKHVEELTQTSSFAGPDLYIDRTRNKGFRRTPNCKGYGSAASEPSPRLRGSAYLPGGQGGAVPFDGCPEFERGCPIVAFAQSA